MKEKCLVRVVERYISKDWFEDIKLILDTEKTTTDKEFTDYANDGCYDFYTDRMEFLSSTVVILKESTFNKLKTSFLNASDFDEATTRTFKFSYFSKWCENNCPSEWNEFSKYIEPDSKFFNMQNIGYCFSSFERKFNSKFNEWEYEEETEAASN